MEINRGLDTNLTYQDCDSMPSLTFLKRTFRKVYDLRPLDTFSVHNRIKVATVLLCHTLVDRFHCTYLSVILLRGLLCLTIANYEF